jgi:hydroxymethylpyrimidine pyrophosphatase-like HAD family hydrolase
MTDVDGTIAAGGEPPAPIVAEAIFRLEDAGISVGLVSGRTLPELDCIARDLAITGPIIAENGGVARLSCDSDLLDLGYSRLPALEALEKLRSVYPGIRERIDNKDRLIDVVFFADGASAFEMQQHIGDVQLVDSGYILHLMQAGISKGETLKRLLEQMSGQEFETGNVLVLGDSLTDLSLFEQFPNSVLVPNPLLDPGHRREIEKAARFVSHAGMGEGFIEVVAHILSTDRNDPVVMSYDSP